MRRGVAIALLVAACAPPATEAVTLSLRAGNCDVADLSRIKMLSVDVYGFDADDQRCVLQQRCISDVEIAADAADPVAEITAILQAQTPPLADTRREGAAWIGIGGRSVRDCFAPADVLCAFADLADTADGALDIVLACGDCPDREWPQCP